MTHHRQSNTLASYQNSTIFELAQFQSNDSDAKRLKASDVVKRWFKAGDV